MNSNVFPLDIRLARGDRLALAPIYLGFLFYRLNKCVKNITSLGRFYVVTHNNTSFLQLFRWERFKTLGLKPAQYDGVEMIEVEDDDGNVKAVLDRPLKMMAHRWSNLKQGKLKEFKVYRF